MLPTAIRCWYATEISVFNLKPFSVLIQAESIALISKQLGIAYLLICFFYLMDFSMLY